MWTTTEISSPFTRWFDADGYFVAQPFQQWLASKVSLIGEADPKNARETKAETTQMEMGESGLAEKAIETPKKSTSAAGATAGSRSRKGKS